MGKVRFFTGVYLIVIGCFITYSKIIRNCKKKYILFFIIQISEIIFVAQTRSITVGVIISLIIVTFIQIIKNRKNRMKFLGIILLISIIFLPYTISIINKLKSNNEDVGLIVRKNAINYMIEKSKESQFLGLGLYENSFEDFGYITGANKGYFYEDVGIFGFVFQYGFVGLIILGYIIIKIIVLTRRLGKNRISNTYYIQYCVYTIVILPFNCILNVDNQILYFLLTISLLESEFLEIEKI